MIFNTETSFLVALVIAVVVFIGYLEWSSAKGRLMRKRQVKMAATLVKDDAYNATVTAKAISRNLKTQGYDVSGVESLIRQAESAIDLGNFKAARGYADDAKTALYALKQRGIAQAMPVSGHGQAAQTVFSGDASADRPGAHDRLQKRELPRNYAQASFAISTLKEETGNALAEGSDTSAVVELLAQAEEEFRQGNYDAALNTALKARKEGTLQPVGERGGLGTVKYMKEKETAPKSEICPACGAEIKEGDSFCRKCGTAFNFVCPDCGGTLEAGDVFCGKCGAGIK